jgi:hypothetical protein
MAYAIPLEPEFLKMQSVLPDDPLEWTISRRGIRTDYDACREDIINECELALNSHV